MKKHSFHVALLAAALWVAGSSTLAGTLPAAGAVSRPGWLGSQLGSGAVGLATAMPQVLATSPHKKKSASKKIKQAVPSDRMPNGETVTNRERRLLRECKGRPNAGACLGYAS